MLLAVRPLLKGSEWATGLSSLDLARQAYQSVDDRAGPKGRPIDAKENERENHFTSLVTRRTSRGENGWQNYTITTYVYS